MFEKLLYDVYQIELNFHMIDAGYESILVHLRNNKMLIK
jgi:hypothetical protein